MLIRNLVLGVAIAGLVAPAVPAQAQSLVELAKQEKARRAALKAKGKTGKSYTEGDTSGNAGTASAAASTGAGETPAAAGAPGEAPKTPEQERADAQKALGEEVKAAQDEMKALQDVISSNERTLASMVNMTPARADIAAKLDADKKKVADLQAKLEQLEEKRRRAGLARQ